MTQNRRRIRKPNEELQRLLTDRRAQLAAANKRLRKEITQRKLAEGAALRANQEWERTFDAVPDLIAILDKDHRILHANQAMAQRLGVSPEQCIGKRCYEVVHGLDHPPAICPHVLTMADGQMHVAEVEEVRLGGSFLVSTTPLTDEEGKPFGSVHVARDITARKRAEEALERRVAERTAELAKSVAMLETVTSNAPVVLFATDAQGAFTVHTGKAISATGRRQGELVGKNFLEALANNSPAANNIRRALEGEAFSAVVESREGTTFETLYAPLRDAQGKVSGLIGLSLDITERHRAEELLRRANAYNRSLIEASLDPLVTISPEGKITDVNRATERITGCSREELIGRDFCDYCTDPAKARAGYEQAFREGWVQDYGLEVQHRDGHVTPVVYNASVYRDEGGQAIGVFAAARDITERKRMEEELRQLSGRVLEAHDGERRRIARDLHDSTIQNLAAIALDLGTIQESAGRMEACQPCRKFLSDSISLTELCLNELRNLTYLLHPPLLEELGLSTALEHYANGFSRRSGIPTTVEIAPELGRIPKDAERTLFRIIQECLTNILRHAASPTARIALLRNPEEVVLEVVDKGRGMRAQSAEKPGSGPPRPGVGIPGMRERVRLLGGRLDIDSGDHGTTVRVTLPLPAGES